MNPKAKVVIKRTAMTGKAKAVGGSVYAVLGGTLDLPAGRDVEIIEEGMTDNAEQRDCQVAATKDHTITIQGENVNPQADTTSVKCQSTFGDGNTAAILLAGTGNGFDVFKQDVDQMKSLLTSQNVGVSVDKIFDVIPRPTSKISTISLLNAAIDNVVEELKGQENASFIFYYSGHFNKKKHQFTIDKKDKDDLNKYLDQTLAKDLSRIPAKYVLYILDTCFSESAEVNAKEDGAPTPEVDSEEAYVPRMWEVPEVRQKGEGEACPPSPEKIVQWSSSLSVDVSYNLASSSIFTKAVVDVVTDATVNEQMRDGMAQGETCVSVLTLNGYVRQRMNKQLAQMNKQQHSVIRPPDANVDYFKAYPSFAKVK